MKHAGHTVSTRQDVREIIDELERVRSRERALAARLEALADEYDDLERRVFNATEADVFRRVVDDLRALAASPLTPRDEKKQQTSEVPAPSGSAATCAADANCDAPDRACPACGECVGGATCKCIDRRCPCFSRHIPCAPGAASDAAPSQPPENER